MKTQQYIRCTFLFAAAFTACIFNALAQNAHEGEGFIKVGDKAPQLKIVKWVKGSQIQEFKKGQVYLIEFGFVSCAPCRMSMPILSKINEKYAGKVSVVGIHIWENNKKAPSDLAYIGKVENFVKEMGNKISYTIGVDVPEQTTADTWGGGAPKGFIIDQQGIIQWIGNPITTNIDSIVTQVVNGTFNAERNAMREKSINDDITKTMNLIWQYKATKKFEGALLEMDQLLLRHPTQGWLKMQKFQLLDGMDEDNRRANMLAKKLIKGSDKSQIDTYKLAQAIIESARPDYDIAMEAIDSALANSDYNYNKANMLEVKARAFFRKGDFENGIESMKISIKILTAYGKERQEQKENMEALLANYIKRYGSPRKQIGITNQ